MWLRGCCRRYSAGSWAEERLHVKLGPERDCHIAICNECCWLFVEAKRLSDLLQYSFYSFIFKRKFDWARQLQHGLLHSWSWIRKASFHGRHKCNKNVLSSGVSRICESTTCAKQLLNKWCFNVCLHDVRLVVISNESPSSVARYCMLCNLSLQVGSSCGLLSYCFSSMPLCENVAVISRLWWCHGWHDGDETVRVMIMLTMRYMMTTFWKLPKAHRGRERRSYEKCACELSLCETHTNALSLT